MENTTRRDFIKSSVAGSAGVIFVPGAFKKFSSDYNPGANDIINVAVVGVHGHGRNHLRQYKEIPGVRIAAVCDVDQEILDREVGNLAKENINVKAYRDIRNLLDNKDIDAVSIATPNHWHALATIWACQAGKHVCVEKPVSHNIREGRKMVEAARKYGRLVQADLDSRSNLSYEAAFEYMQEHLGRILLVRIVNYKRRKSIGKVMGPGTIPATVDFDLWTGPTPMKPLLRENMHYDWHWQWATGNSEIGNNGPHQLDICRWALRKNNLPNKVFSFDGRYGYVDDGETPNTHVVYFDYDGIPVIYDSRGLSREPGIETMDGITIYTATGKKVNHPFEGSANCSIAFICENGYLYGTTLYDNDGKEVMQFNREGIGNSLDNFNHALRTNKTSDLKTDILEGHLSTSICHMGNISYQTGQKHAVEILIDRIRGNEDLYQVFIDMRAHLSKHGVDLEKEQIIIGRELTMDSKSERFTGENSGMANLFLKDSSREPFIVPQIV